MTRLMKALSRIAAGGILAVGLATPMSAQAAAKFPPRPTPGPARPPIIPKVAQQTLANGIRLAVVENHALPIVAVRIGFAGVAGDSFLDAAGKEGGWGIMLASLREGTTTRSATAIADATADLGTTITWSPLAATAGFPSFTTTRSEWRPSLDILGDMIVHPAFPEDAFKRIQSAQAASNSRVPAATAAQRTLNATIFGASHPYGRSITETSIRSLTRDDIVGLANTYLRPQNTVVVVVGDVTPSDARAAVEHAFAGWEQGGTTVEPNIPAPPPRTDPTTIYLRDDPGSATATIRSGSVLPGRGAPDAIAIEAVNAIVGGITTGRMWQAFRVDRGLSYAPSTVFSWRPGPQPGLWAAAVNAVPAAKADTAVTELLRVFREAHGERAPTAAELEFARGSMLGALSATFSTVDFVAAATLHVMQTRLPTTFYNDQVGRINGITLAQFQGAAAKYIDPDHMVIVVVGDRAKLEAPLRATGIPVVIVDK